jgi:hypothetical protein
MHISHGALKMADDTRSEKLPPWFTNIVPATLIDELEAVCS